MKDPFEDIPMRARNAVLGSVTVVALLILLSILFPTTMGTVGVLAFFLIVVIGFHELGHFVFAKRAGMKVTEFFIGFGPRLWSVQRGETEYGIKALPLGGYCKIIGMTNLEETDPADADRTFRSKGFWAKTTTLLAGPASHFVLAFIMMWVVVGFKGDIAKAKATTTLAFIEAGSPAAKAGIRPGDRVTAFDNQRVGTYAQLSNLIHARPNRTVTVIVDRGAQQLALTATLEHVTSPTGTTIGRLGIESATQYDKPGPIAALAVVPARLWDATTATVSGLGHVFSPSGFRDYLSNFTRDTAKKEQDNTAADHRAENARFVSLVGVGRLANDAVSSGWVSVLGLLIGINISVGLVNLLPLIPFDGGHIAIAGYEAIMSRIYRRTYRVDFAKVMPIAIATLTFFAFIFLSSMFLDIAKPTANPF